MTQKIKIEENTVAATLVLPLYGRVKMVQKYPNIFPDAEAEDALEKIDYDFNKLNYSDFTLASWSVRRRFLYERAQAYLENHPRATIINLGCGVDESFSAVDNGSCKWVNLDLQEVIEAREKLMKPKERESNIAADAFDLSWCNKIDNKDDGVFIIAGGVLMFFKDEKTKPLLSGIAEKFPGGGICFDIENEEGVNKSNKVLAKSGNKGAMVQMIVNDAEEKFSPWSDSFETIKTFNSLPQWAKGMSFITKTILGIGFKKGYMGFAEIIFKEV